MSTEYKVAVCGTGGVGKSCLTVQYVQNTFLEEYDPTIEDSYTKQTKVDDTPCYLQILDTAGQEEYVALQDTYMRAREGFVVIFDLTKKKTLYEVPRFVEKIRQVKDVNSFPLVIVGNKCDLVSEREVSEEEVKKLITEFQKQDGNWNIPFYECSAKQRINVDEAFNAIVKELRKKKPVGPTTTGTTGKKCLIL